LNHRIGCQHIISHPSLPPSLPPYLLPLLIEDAHLQALDFAAGHHTFFGEEGSPVLEGGREGGGEGGGGGGGRGMNMVEVGDETLI